MSDWPILRDKRESKPRLGSSAGGPVQKMENVVVPHDTNPASTEDPRKFLPYTIFLFLLTFSFLLSISRPRGLVVSQKSFTLSVQYVLGAGSGIRTHAARKGHRLSRPAPLDPHLRLIHSAHGTQLHVA